MRNSGAGISRRPGADDGRGSCQERNGQADGVVGANGEEIFKDDRGGAVKGITNINIPSKAEW